MPQLKTPDDLEVCDTCATAKGTKQPRGPPSLVQPLWPRQELHMDYGFMATLKEDEATSPEAKLRKRGPKPAKTQMPAMSVEPPPHPEVKTTMFGIDPGTDLNMDKIHDRIVAVEGIHGYKSYLIIVCKRTRYIWVFLTKDKEPPLHILELWFLQHGLNNGQEKFSGCIVRTDQGGELAGSTKFKNVCSKAGYLVETTGKDASSQNAIAEAPHRRAGEAVRAVLHNANLLWSIRS